MKCTRTAIALLATVLSATGAYAQTPNGAPERDFPRVQTPPKPSETTGAGTPAKRARTYQHRARRWGD
jgi:hypothetical protein